MQTCSRQVRESAPLSWTGRSANRKWRTKYTIPRTINTRPLPSKYQNIVLQVLKYSPQSSSILKFTTETESDQKLNSLTSNSKAVRKFLFDTHREQAPTDSCIPSHSYNSPHITFHRLLNIPLCVTYSIRENVTIKPIAATTGIGVNSHTIWHMRKGRNWHSDPPSQFEKMRKTHQRFFEITSLKM